MLIRPLAIVLSARTLLANDLLKHVACHFTGFA